MSQTSEKNNIETEKDLVLRELWQAKEALSAARGHSVDKLFADLRERENVSGHRVVNLQAKPDAVDQPPVGQSER